MQGWQYRLEGWHWRADRIGEASLRLFDSIRRFYGLTISVLGIGLRLQWLSHVAVKYVMVRQIYFTGVQSVPWVVLISLGAGVLAVYNIVIFAKSIQDMSLIGSLISNVLVQEIAPLFVTIFLLARSGVAVVTEVAHMHIRGEDMTLRSLGINIKEYLFWPRVMAFAVCGLILTFMFVAISIWVGGLISAWAHQLNLIDFLVEVRRGTSIGEVLMMIGKGMLYPLLCCVMLLDQGCRVGRDPNQIPVRATFGVLGSLMTVILLDVLFVLLGGLL